MSSPTFDVYVTGTREDNPSAQMRIATSIAARYRLPAPTVAAALGGNACRVAERLPGHEAQAVIDTLAALGATGRLSPAGVPLGHKPPTADDSMSAPRKDFRITLKSAEVGTQAAPMVVDIAEPIEFAEPGPDGRTGVRGADTVRCQIHGLVYNRRQASGCIRCLGRARAQARKLREGEDEGTAQAQEAATERTTDETPDEAECETARGLSRVLAALRRRFAGTPARRAFAGLALALALGFLPAVYYARVSNHGELANLRAQQAQVSLAPPTADALARFDQLDVAVHAAHLGGAGRTLLIWMAAAAVTGAIWTKLT